MHNDTYTWTSTDDRHVVDCGITQISGLHRLLRDEEVARSNPVARPLSPDRQNGLDKLVIDQTVVVLADGMTTDQPHRDPLPLPHGRSVAIACSIRCQWAPTSSTQ